MIMQAFWYSRNLALKVVWFLRAQCYRGYWRLRTTMLHSFWFSRALALRTFWFLRALGYRVYWKLRSLPYHIRHILRNIFYKYLHKYRCVKIIREAVRAFSSRIFKVKTIIRHGFKGRKYTLIPLSSFISDNQAESIGVDAGGQLTVDGPRFIGDYEFSPIASNVVELSSPGLVIACLKNVAVIGGTNFLLSGDFAIYPDLYVPERDVCPAELNGIAKLDHRFKSISLYYDQEITLDYALSLVGSCTGNYAHWLTETLPKLLLTDLFGEFDHYPLIVDEWIHPNFLDTIYLLGKSKREIIKVSRWGAIRADSLLEVSLPAYVPPEYRYFHETKRLDVPRAEDFPFSAMAMNVLRNRALDVLSQHPYSGPENIYLYRSPESCGNTRHVVNLDEIEEIVKIHNYVMIDPARLSFEEQVLLFRGAKKIVSPIGAALANTIFTPPGCQVIGLSPYYENANYYYFSNYMGVLGHKLHYVLGRQLDQGGHPFHKDYKVEMKAFVKAMDFLDSSD